MKTLTLALLTIILAYLVITLANRNLPQLLDKLFSPCRKPMHWRVDAVDERFGLSRDTFIQDAQQASQIWNKSISKDLFAYDTDGPLSINLIFDERQSISNQIDQLQNQAQDEKNDIKPKIGKYQSLAQDFKKRLANLNNEISFWNKQGGAPQDVYDRLTKDQNDLIQGANRLNAMAKDLNLSQDQYNVTVDKLNGEIITFNQALQARPEEGIYEKDQNRIEIYFNINHNELVHTLAHEMGHALGLSHINDPKAIMYPNTTQQIVALESDIAALNQICHSLL